MSNEIPLPTTQGVSTADWRLERNVAEFESWSNKATQRLSRTGNRWRAQLGFNGFQLENAGILTAFYDEISRGDRWLFLSPPQNTVRGSWNPTELLTNGTLYADVTTGWTASGASLSINARRMKVKNSGATRGGAYQDITMEANKPHVLLADSFQGNVTTGTIEVRRVSDSVVEATDASFTAPKRTVLLVTPTVASMRVMLFTQTSVANDYTYYGGVSLCRCLQVNGPSQTGNRLNVDGGPISVNGALKTGEFVCFLIGSYYQLVRLKEDFDTDSSGAGQLVFEPALRGSPADNAPVIVRKPFSRFRCATPQSQQVISPPVQFDFAMEVVEDFS